MNIKTYIILLINCFPIFAVAQTNTENKITDNNHSLYSFYEQLYRLQQEAIHPVENDSLKIHQVSIMHIGDSHVQAGFFSGSIMNLLQEKFGSAGRGLVFPLKLAKTNEPFDYLISSGSKWDRTLCVQVNKKLPVGLGGLSIRTNDPDFSFGIKSSVNKKADHSFNKITVFHHPKAPELMVEEKDIDSKTEKTNDPFTTTIHLGKRVNQLYLHPVGLSVTDSSIYYGFNLENGKSGILYHAVGINGAQFRHYASVQDFTRQISILSPQLFIFSLGTNEAFRGELSTEKFIKEIDTIIQPILTENPEALVLIITPPDCLKQSQGQKKESNPHISQIRDVLIQYADKNKFAYWDLFSLLGGNNSASRLLEDDLLAKDGVHFTVNGYQTLGNLFFDALLNEYTNYVQHRTR